MLVVASSSELIAQGHLVAPTVYTVPSHLLPDVSRVAIQRGDYAERALAEAVNKPALVGSIVEHALRHGRGAPTLLFAVNVDHSRQLVRELESAGIRAEHLDGSSSTEVRDAVLARLRSGETEVVSNCALFGEGLDIPQVKRVILARPTASTGLYLQQVGRVMRPFEGQQALVLDHAGSVMRHGLPQDDREFTLDSSALLTRRERDAARAARVCAQCYAVMSLASRTCPACGIEAQHEAPEQVDGTLIEVYEGSLAQKVAELTRLRRVAKREGHHPCWVRERYQERFGEPPPDGASLGQWRPHTAAQRSNYLESLMASESSPAWARVRYRVEVGQWAES
jgi:superfamily II DNA or RNA helicase